MEDIHKTLGDVITALMSYREQNPEKASDYNVFKVLQINHREVLMCRVLADLLNPSGSHGFGRRFLDVFLQRVFPERYDELKNKTIFVHKEYPITADRRIDIVLHGDGVFLPVEVKINAGDQANQCYDYYHFAYQRDKNTKVIYLTKHGYFPSEESRKSKDGSHSLDDNDIIRISFGNDILNWLQEIVDMIEDKNVKATIEQYSDSIEDFCSDEPQNETDYIVEATTKDENNFRSALKIANTINTTKAEIMTNLFEDIDKAMEPFIEKYGLKREDVFHWYDYHDQSNSDFYKQLESTYPGLNYVIKNAALSNGVELWFRIEIDYKLFAMFAVFDTKALNEEGELGNQKDDIYQCDDLQNEIRKYLNFDVVETKCWIVTWKYLPTGSASQTVSINQVPDFKEMNEAAIKLSDQAYRREFVDSLMPVIEQEFMKQLK